jgi:hypothetical protein
MTTARVKVRLSIYPSMPETRSSEPSKSSGCLDKVLLVGAALLVCVIGGAAFWIAEDYHVNPAWVFFLWNSAIMVPIFIKDFRSHLRKPAFVAFLVVWGITHGLVVVVLMRCAPITVWFLGISIELLVGFMLADRIFGVRRAPKRQRSMGGVGLRFRGF